MRRRVMVIGVLLGCGRSEPAEVERGAAPPVQPKSAAAERPGPQLTIPAGTFSARTLMCEPGTLRLRRDRPEREPMRHEAFAIDARPVSCAELEACFAAGACTHPGAFARTCQVDVAYAHHVVAAQYCATRGMRLPTWVEWQRAVGEVRPASPPCSLAADGDARCPVTSSTGFSFGFPTDSLGELTSDRDCDALVTGTTPTTFRQVAVALDLVKEVGPATLLEYGEFRCAKSL